MWQKQTSITFFRNRSKQTKKKEWFKAQNTTTQRQNYGKTYSSHEWAVTVFDFRTCPHLKRMTPADVWDSVDQSNLHGKSFHQWVFVLFAESNGPKVRRMYYYRAKKTIPPLCVVIRSGSDLFVLENAPFPSFSSFAHLHNECVHGGFLSFFANLAIGCVHRRPVWVDNWSLC